MSPFQKYDPNLSVSEQAKKRVQEAKDAKAEEKQHGYLSVRNPPNIISNAHVLVSVNLSAWLFPILSCVPVA